AAAANGGAVLGGTAVLDLCVERLAKRAAHLRLLAQIAVDREAVGQRDHIFFDGFLDTRIVAVRPGLAQAVEHAGYQHPDLAELRLAEAASRPRRRTEADARRDERLLGIEGNAVLVAGDV